MSFSLPKSTFFSSAPARPFHHQNNTAPAADNIIHALPEFAPGARWTAESLRKLIADHLSGWKIIVVSNREPVLHRHGENGIERVTTAGGVTAALRPILEASGGTWIAHGAGDADRDTADAQGRLGVPEENPAYTLRRVWLTGEQERGYYYGLANEGLWPLCHVTFQRPVFRLSDWERYREVNRLFAQTVLEEAGDEPTFVFVQDYHFCLLPRLLKESGRGNIVAAQFWHIPWPGRENFRVFPWAEELLHGLTGNDLLGFHIPNHCQSFFDTVEYHLKAGVDRELGTISYQGRETKVHPFPISIDFAGLDRFAQGAEVKAAVARWKEKLPLSPGLALGIGIERLDYTKGIAERLRAIDLFLEEHPEWRERFLFVQIAAPSRSNLPSYQKMEAEIVALAEAINQRWGTPRWTPVRMLRRHHGQTDLTALRRLAQFMIVNSLHDGMNLVAKEYCASRFDEDGVLILSRFTGAQWELGDALGINPYAIHEMAGAIHQALSMPPLERRNRMRRMRETIRANNVYRWAGHIMASLLNFELSDDTPPHAGPLD